MFVVWISFILLILIFLALDLGVFHRKAHVIEVREALLWSVVWVLAALAFNVWIYFMYEYRLFHIGDQFGRDCDLDGLTAAGKFFTVYIVEKSLSLDNIFVISLIFAYFGVPAIYQHRVLFWGILGAIVLRGVMIGLGATILHYASWMIYGFGAILILTAIKMLVSKHEAVCPDRDPIAWLVKKLFPVTKEYHGERFFVRLDGRLFLTPLFIALLVVESADIVFAVDSIPAAFGITTDPFLVFTSNIFAILGLRSLYFALAAMIRKFRYLKISLVVILFYVGCKMLCFEVIEHYGLSRQMTWVSLGVILLVMFLGVAASVFSKRGEDEDEDEDEERARTLHKKDLDL